MSDVTPTRGEVARAAWLEYRVARQVSEPGRAEAWLTQPYLPRWFREYELGFIDGSRDNILSTMARLDLGNAMRRAQLARAEKALAAPKRECPKRSRRETPAQRGRRLELAERQRQRAA